MREIVFLNKNSKRWEEFEAILKAENQASPDVLADLFVELTDDLAYARTYYPQSKLTAYLNRLTLQAHRLIYKNKREKKGRIAQFWLYEFPMVIREKWAFIAYSSLIFSLAVLIGIISTAYDHDFLRLIVGDAYVDITLNNIEKGDPMAVYKSANESAMFLGITINNVRVSFLAFVFGVFTPIAVGWILFQNGVMLGSFLTFFYQYNLLHDAMLTVWLHGTLEIFAILVAGAAGLMVGNSIVFPKTYSRLVSFKRETQKGMKIIIGLIPLFVVAGFIEGFITRWYQSMPDALRMFIIAASVLFIVWYFFLFPQQLKNAE